HQAEHESGEPYGDDLAMRTRLPVHCSTLLFRCGTTQRVPRGLLAAPRLRRPPRARGVPRPSTVKIGEIQGLEARSYCAALLNGWSVRTSRRAPALTGTSAETGVGG